MKGKPYEMKAGSLISRGAAALLGAVVIRKMGADQKWQVAYLVTLIPFWSVVKVLRTRWKRISYWTSLSIWLALHLLVVWLVFSVALRNSTHASMLFGVVCCTFVTALLLVFSASPERKLRPRNPDRSIRARKI